MKNFTLPAILLSLITLILVLPSCSVDKRLYRKGYHIEWNSKAPAAAEAKPETKSDDIKPLENVLLPIEAIDEASTLSASVNGEPLVIPQPVIEVPAPQQPEVNDEATRFILSQAVIEVPSQPAVGAQQEKAEKQLVFKKAPVVKKIMKHLRLPDQTGDVKPHWLSILSLVAGILSLVAYYGAIPLGILAIVFGAIALRKINANPDTYRGRGMAIAGIICGIVALAIIITVLVFVL